MAKSIRRWRQILFALALLFALGALHLNAQQRRRARAQTQSEAAESEFGPNVRTYLSYLRDEQEVVDDRVSRREISRAYYIRNSNRIRALRRMAIQIARETKNDYLPEMDAVTRDEFGRLFEHPPKADALRLGEVIEGTYRFLGAVRSNETFYIFARLSVFEQQEQMNKKRAAQATGQASANQHATTETHFNRPRRVGEQ
jgi:hypothetical protein